MSKKRVYPMHWERMLNYGKVSVRCPQCRSLFGLKSSYSKKIWKITKCIRCSTPFTHLEITKSNYWYWPISVPIDKFNSGAPLVHVIFHTWFEYQRVWDKIPERGVELPANINYPINQKLLNAGYFHARRIRENEMFKNE